MHDQRGHVEFLEIFVEVSLRKCLDAVIDILEPALHAPKPKLIQHSLRDLRTRPIGAIKHDGEVLPELRTVLGEAATQSVEHFDRNPFRVGSRLHKYRWHRSN